MCLIKGKNLIVKDIRQKQDYVRGDFNFDFHNTGQSEIYFHGNSDFTRPRKSKSDNLCLCMFKLKTKTEFYYFNENCPKII